MHHIIKNFNELATSALRRAVLSIAEAAYESINTTRAIERLVKYYPRLGKLKILDKQFRLGDFRRIRILGIGKAALEAAKALRRILGDKITDGYVLDVKTENLGAGIISRAGTHPLASELNYELTQQILTKFGHSDEKDLVLCIISGGGSALFCSPYRQTPEQEAEIFKILTAQGASIFEINTVRKHTSLVKGGRLATVLCPATVVGLIFSDVPGDDLSMVASGPLVRDTTEIKDAVAVLEKYGVLEKARRPKIELLESPKDLKYFEKVSNLLLVSGRSALLAMRSRAEDLGFAVKNYSEQFQGEARLLGREIATVVKPGECLLGIGESTVTLAGKGLGGRNQEMALGALLALKEDETFGAFASDGHDNTEAAGAVADASTLTRAVQLGFDPVAYLQNNDSFRFFEATGDLVYTGLTGANVADFFVCLRR